MPTFVCYRCNNEFPTRSEEDAIAEYKANFPNATLEDRGDPLCDACFEEFWKWAAINAPELKRIY